MSMHNQPVIPYDIVMNRYIVDLLKDLEQTCATDRLLDVKSYMQKRLSKTFSDSDFHIVVTEYRETHPLTDLNYIGWQLSVSILSGELYEYTLQVVRLHPEDHYRLSEYTKKLMIVLKGKCDTPSNHLLGDYVDPNKVLCSKLL